MDAPGVARMRHRGFPARVRSLVKALALFGVGAGALALTAGLALRSEGPRPPSAGEVGEVVVYAQFPNGPRPLRAGQKTTLRRPQHLVFRVHAVGTGPRWLRVELETETEIQTLHEAHLVAPLENHPLGFIARFGERDPDRFTVVVRVEAPHDRPRVWRYPLALMTRAHRFWDGER